MNIVNLIKKFTASSPNKKALVENNKTITYGELEIETSKMVLFLKSSGIKSGDSVLVFIPMSINLYVLLIALFKMKATAVFIDPYQDTAFIEKCCSSTLPKAMIGVNLSFLLGLKSNSIKQIPIKIPLNHFWGFRKSLSDYTNYREDNNIVDANEGTPALITFTSGSTGEPKAIVRTHGFLETQHKILEETLCLSRVENILVSFPMFVLTNLAAGVTCIIPPKYSQPKNINASKIINLIETNNVDTLLVPPLFLDKILKEIDHQDTKLNNIRYVYTGGAPVFPVLLEKCQNLFSNAEINAIYGASEAEPISKLPYKEISNTDLVLMRNGNGLLAGSISKNIKISFADRNGKIIKNSSQGEICVTGNHVLKGYLGGIGDGESKILYENEIWHKTGDGGYLDKNGRLWLTGRVSAEIITDNKTFYPLKIETPFTWIRGIGKTALGLRDKKLCLYVEKSSIIDNSELEKKAFELGISKIIKLRKIPVDKRHNGKILYKKL